MLTQSILDIENAKNSNNDLNSTNDGLVQPKGLGSIVSSNDNENQKFEELLQTDKKYP